MQSQRFGFAGADRQVNDGARAKKTSAASTTLYPSASVEIVHVGASQSYTRFPHMDVVLKDGGVRQFLHRDHLASVRFVTDSTGAVVESTSYAAYGERLNSAMQSQKGFIGERHDPETGWSISTSAISTRCSAALSRLMIGTRSNLGSAPTAMPMRITIR